MPGIRSFLRTLLTAALVLALVGAQSPGPGNAGPDLTYLTMSDGVKVAVSIAYPAGFDSSQGWPALFYMEGYAGGGAAATNPDYTAPSAYGDKYVVVRASIRGTGCSGGRFDLFDRRHALDGYEIIEWLGQGLTANALRPAQPKPVWSNGDVGIIGHSFPGLTGWLVASTNPPHLKAIAISGLIDDLYRGIVYPGGVPNFGFPAFWTLLARPALEYSGNLGRYSSETAGGDPTCAANIAGRPPKEILDDPVVQGLSSQEDEPWWQVRSLVTWIDGIRKPIHITSQYQDEQTGPRASILFQRIPNTIPKRLVLTNGLHTTTSIALADRRAWLDCHMRGVCADLNPDPLATDFINDPSRRVRLYFDQQSHSTPTNSPYVSSDWPLPETAWTRYHLCADGTLSTSPALNPNCAGKRDYVSSPADRHATEVLGFLGPDGDQGAGRLTFAGGLPDELAYQLTFLQDTAVAGPINLTLHASSTAVNTDFFVDVLDVAPSGAVSYLQRGLQRASHRAIDDLRSDFVPGGPEAGSYYRAHHPHTNTTAAEALLTPGVPQRFEIEVFPVGHVFRADHKLVLKIHAPSPKDPLSIYAWVSAQPPAVNTVYRDALRLSSILLPIVPSLPPGVIGAEPACGALAGVPCFTPVA